MLFQSLIGILANWKPTLSNASVCLINEFQSLIGILANWKLKHQKDAQAQVGFNP